MLKHIPKEIVMDNGSVWHPKEGRYLADDETGRIWSTYLQDWLKGQKDKDGYFKLKLMCEEGKHDFKVHRLVWETFCGPIPQGMTINHKFEGEEGKQMNMLSNIELMTQGDNNRYGTRIERITVARSKQVYQYTTEGKLVRIWSSIAECRRNGFDMRAVWRCCNGKGKTHHGFLWSYEPLEESTAPLAEEDGQLFLQF